MTDTSLDESVTSLLGLTDDEALVNEINEHIRDSRNHRSEWRIEARDSYDFFAGIQWDEKDSARLREQGRPPVVFNRIVRTINAVSGIEIQNRQEVTYLPRNVEPEAPLDATTDTGYADMLNGASKWVRDQNGAEDEESECFVDLLITGEGWTETRMDFDDDPEGMIVKNRLDPLQILVDPRATKKNYADAKWVAYITDMTKAEIKLKWPNLEYIAGKTIWNEVETSPHDADNDWRYLNDQSHHMSRADKISVVQYQYFVYETQYVIFTPDGNLITIDEKKFKLARALIEREAIKIVPIKVKAFKQVFIVGNEIAEKNEIGTDFTLQGMTGLRDRNRRLWFGLVSLMKDPQRWANKWLSQIQFILNSNSKGGLFVETGATTNMRKLEDNWTSPDSIIELQPGGLSKIQERGQAQYPDGIDRLLNYAINAINDVPGINLELIGMADRDQPNILEMGRKKAGITILAAFFDALRRYRKRDGRLLGFFIREYIADGRLIRIDGEEGAKYVPLIKDKVAFKYDIVIDEAPTSPNSKEKTFAVLMQLLPVALQSGIPVPPEILDYMPLPQSVINAWKKQVNSDDQTDPVMEQLKQIQLLSAQLDLEKKEADIQKVGSETVKNYSSAKKDASVADEQEALAMQKFGVLQSDQMRKNIEMRANIERKDLEMVLTNYRKMLEMQLEDTLKRRNMGAYPSLNTIQ